MKNKELPNILNNFRDDKISLKYAVELINKNFFNISDIVINALQINKSNEFICEFENDICKNYTCPAMCFNKMKTEYVLFKKLQKTWGLIK